VTFERLSRVLWFLPAWARERLFWRLPRRLRDAAWRDLAERLERERETR
jgi:hypothetical protein